MTEPDASEDDAARVRADLVRCYDKATERQLGARD